MSRLLDKEINNLSQPTRQSEKMKNSFTKFTQVVPDGKIIFPSKDPPGQHSVYIRPGDPSREIYRLPTFEKFPEHSPVSPFHLATKGFFYTGYKDRVKCFSCSYTVENWSQGDDPLSSHWHSSACQFTRGTDNTNKPINMPLTQQLTQANINPITKNTTSAPLNAGTFQNISTATALPTFELLLHMFPCLNPVNPHMRSKIARLQTFRDRSDKWPAHRIAATPEQLSQAGFYYLGERDRVKCWYCNGGLQNWMKFDEPWFEHAKWFPNCEYILQQKGPEFVERVTNRFPNLNRPSVTNPADHLAVNTPQTTSRIRVLPASNTDPQIIDPREQQNKLDKKVTDEMHSSSFTLEAKMMGFGEKEI